MQVCSVLVWLCCYLGALVNQKKKKKVRELNRNRSIKLAASNQQVNRYHKPKYLTIPNLVLFMIKSATYLQKILYSWLLQLQVIMYKKDLHPYKVNPKKIMISRKYSLHPKLFGLYSILGCSKIMSCLKSQIPLIY